VAVGSTQAAASRPIDAGRARSEPGKTATCGARPPSACRPSAVSIVAWRQKFGLPATHIRQVPSTFPLGLSTTRWPTDQPDTSSPTQLIVPVASCPITTPPV
jgi:hypothetical protein